jgi:hypothetical protein
MESKAQLTLVGPQMVAHEVWILQCNTYMCNKAINFKKRREKNHQELKEKDSKTIAINFRKKRVKKSPQTLRKRE